MEKQQIVIGTRGSQLALWQAHYTKNILEEKGFEVKLQIIKTSGDISQAWNLSFEKMEGKGFFTKELEDALLNKEIDLAVHSCKDLPTEYPQGLTIGAYSYRDNPKDVLLIKPEAYDASSAIPLKKGTLVGTSSARRKNQLLAHRPDLELKDLRGNVPTRIEKLQRGDYDAIVLAAAGLRRLAIEADGLIEVELGAPLYIPAPAQGILAYQIRENDDKMAAVCELLHDADAYSTVQLERDILKEFHGGCQIPLGVYVAKACDETHLWISKGEQWDAPVKRVFGRIPSTDIPSAESLVKQFQQITPQSVFISRQVSPGDIFHDWLSASGFSVAGQSLIDIRYIDFEYPNSADWLFFTSKNGVKSFFEKVVFEKGKAPKMAAINKGTAMDIVQAGYDVSFIGTDTDTTRTIHQFAPLASGKILFPKAQNSANNLSAIVQSLGLDAENLIVYTNTAIEHVEKRSEAILVFTSPMNAKAYFDAHALQAHQKVVSIGPATSKELSRLGISYYESYDPMPWSLSDAVMWLSK